MEDKKEFAEDMAATFEVLFIDIGGKALQKAQERYFTEITRLQKAQGEVETAIQKAKSTLTAIEKGITERSLALADLNQKLPEKQGELDRIEARLAELTPVVEGLRSEVMRHARDSMEILTGKEGAA